MAPIWVCTFEKKMRRGVLDTESALKGGYVAKPLPEKVVSRVIHTAQGGPMPTSFGSVRMPETERFLLTVQSG